MANPNPPIGAIFRPDGLFLTLIEKDSVTQRLVSWEELHKLAKKGKKLGINKAAQEFAKKANEVIDSNKAFMEQSEKRAAESRQHIEELKKMRESRPVARPAVVAVPVAPMPPAP
jgi:hypothetical protein